MDSAGDMACKSSRSHPDTEDEEVNTRIRLLCTALLRRVIYSKGDTLLDISGQDDDPGVGLSGVWAVPLRPRGSTMVTRTPGRPTLGRSSEMFTVQYENCRGRLHFAA